MYKKTHNIFEDIFEGADACEYCGEFSGNLPLCADCYNLAKENAIVKNENGKWVKNVRYGNEYKFYDPTKIYTLKSDLLGKYEMLFFNAIRKKLSRKYIIIPQVNLQTIIDTDTSTRNDELFRNIDFMIYYANKFRPFLAIEINGKQHYTNDYWIERDKSVKSILSDVKLPLLTIDVEDIKKTDKKHIQKLVLQVIKYLNSNKYSEQKDKMDLKWAEDMIKKLGE